MNRYEWENVGLASSLSRWLYRVQTEQDLTYIPDVRTWKRISKENNFDQLIPVFEGLNIEPQIYLTKYM